MSGLSAASDVIYSDYNTEPLPMEEERRLVPLAQSGDTAASHRIIQANLRFVITVAHQYHSNQCPMTMEELISEGNMGMMRALEKFDPARGFKFISYAVWWIRQSILYALETQCSVVRRPMGRKQVRMEVSKHVNLLAHQLERDPTIEEIAGASGVTPSRLQAALQEATTDSSLDSPVRADGTQTYGDLVLIDPSSPDEPLEHGELQILLTHNINQLNDLEARVIRYHYGLGDQLPLSLEAIGKLIGRTRERVRQLRNNALEKMREHMSQSPHTKIKKEPVIIVPKQSKTQKELPVAYDAYRHLQQNENTRVVFLQRLKEALDQSGLSKEELADMMGVNPRTCGRYLSGEHLPRPKNLFRIAVSLRCGVQWLAGLRDA